MKTSVRNWNFVRLFRLTAGIAGTVQGFMMREFALSLAAILFSLHGNCKCVLLR
jgi:hypothetical protein